MGKGLWSDFQDSLKYPEFWIYAMWLDLLSKYRRSRLGLLWAVIPSVLYAYGIGGFYARLAKTGALDMIAHLGIGYVVYRFITVSLSECTATFGAHAAFIQDGRTRLTDYVLRVMARAFFYFLMAVPVLVVALSMAPSFRAAGLAALIPALCVVIFNVAWMGIVVGILGARTPDIQELIGSVLMVSFLFTPIIWRADQAPSDTLQGFVARLNPLFHLVEVVRAPILGEPIGPATLLYLALMTLLGWLLASILYRRYAKFVPIWI